jgi:hypothetical protein
VSVSIAVVCEAPVDKRTGCDLADRVICEAADWITVEVIDDYRLYRGYRAHEEALEWKQVPGLAMELNIRAHGWFSGEPGAPDALATRRALLVLRHSPECPDAVILLRDADQQSQREKGLTQAREEMRRTWRVPIVIGLASTMRECWVIAGFLPEDDEERALLESFRDGKQLGFDPTLHPERLTARRETAKKNSKRVLRLLTGGDPVREARCWRETPIATLEERGKKVGLTDYLRELRKLLVALFV